MYEIEGPLKCKENMYQEGKADRQDSQYYSDINVEVGQR